MYRARIDQLAAHKDADGGAISPCRIGQAERSFEPDAWDDAFFVPSVDLDVGPPVFPDGPSPFEGDEDSPLPFDRAAAVLESVE